MPSGLLTLSMIVKDEAATLAPTLASIRPYIDRWIILDTGSTDGTHDVIRAALAGVPGELCEEPFVDFATSRNRALDLAGTETDFVMWLDADDELVGGEALRAFLEGERTSTALDREAYLLRVEMGLIFDSPRIARTRAGWRFQGAVHEVLMHGERQPPDCRIPGVLIRHHPGQDSRERSQRRWARDAALLEASVAADPSNARAAFYLAMTYHWQERFADAAAAFRRRIALGGWVEEIYQSKAALARVAEAQAAPWPEVEALWLDAQASAPHRAEPFHAIAGHYLTVGDLPRTFAFAKRGVALPLPERDTLFIDEGVYSWKLAALVSASAHAVGEYALGAAMTERALVERPEDPTLLSDLARYRRHLAEGSANAGSAHPARIPYEACPLCDSRDFHEFVVADCTGYPHYKPELPPTQRWMRCRACEHVFVDGVFNSAALAVLFSKTHASQAFGYELEAARYVSSKMVNDVVSVRPDFLGRWLDVGFGNGSLLTTAAEGGWDVVGLELRSENVQQARAVGLDAHVAELTDYHPSVGFDVISMADVLEHMVDPRAALAHAHASLRDDGILFLSMPNSDSFVWKQLSKNQANPYWAELEHYHNFGRERLFRLLVEHGFEPRRYSVSHRYRACMEVVAQKVSAEGRSRPTVSRAPREVKPASQERPATLRLNVGCGRSPMPGWVNIDSVDLPGVDMVVDLERARLDLRDDSVVEINASHFLEHIHNSLGLMQELHRVAASNAVATFRVPYGSSDDADEDPTHVRRYFWSSWGYFSQPYYWRADYGYRGDWELEDIALVVDADVAALPWAEAFAKVQTSRNVVKEMVATLRCVKPARQALRELQKKALVRFVTA